MRLRPGCQRWCTPEYSLQDCGLCCELGFSEAKELSCCPSYYFSRPLPRPRRVHIIPPHTCLSIKLHNYTTKRPIKTSNTTADLFPPHTAFLWSVGAYYWWGYQSLGVRIKYQTSRLYMISQWNTVRAYFRPSSIPFHVGRALVTGFSLRRSSFAATTVHVCFGVGNLQKDRFLS